MIVRSSCPYNGIIGRPRVRKIQAVLSTAHGMLKFPVPRGVLALQSSRIIPLECTMVSEPGAQPSDVIQAAKERIKKPADMTGVSRHIVEHRLNVREGCSLVRQKKRSQLVIDCANMGMISLRRDRRVLVMVARLPRTVYHNLYLSGEALAERENVGFDLARHLP
ncbi:hypothetical protein Tco_0889369 [Tanacetum coccineum]